MLGIVCKACGCKDFTLTRRRGGSVIISCDGCTAFLEIPPKFGPTEEIGKVDTARMSEVLPNAAFHSEKPISSDSAPKSKRRGSPEQYRNYMREYMRRRRSALRAAAGS